MVEVLECFNYDYKKKQKGLEKIDFKMKFAIFLHRFL